MSALAAPKPDARPDLDWLALAWYGQTVQYLCAAKGLRPLATDSLLAGPLAAHPGVASGHLVAASPELGAGGFDGSLGVVVGGPCIGDCTRFPTVEALYDSVQTLLVGRSLGAPVLLYLGDREEALERGGGDETWSRLARRFEPWLRSLAGALEVPELHVVRTASAEHEAALERAGGVLASGPELDGAFHLGAEAPPEQPENSRGVTRRVVAAHLPPVVGAHVSRRGPCPDVIIVENLQQSGVYRLARTAAESVTGGSVRYVGFWPAPGLSAERRMYRADSWNKVPAWELETMVTGELAGLQGGARRFLGAWLDADLRRRLAEVARAW